MNAKWQFFFFFVACLIQYIKYEWNTIFDHISIHGEDELKIRRLAEYFWRNLISIFFFWVFDIKHLMTGHKGNSEFCFPKTLNVEHWGRGQTKFTVSGGPVIKSDFLRMSRIGRHRRKIDFSFISSKHTFGWTYSRKNSLKLPPFILRPKFKKVRNLHIMVFFAA